MEMQSCSCGGAHGRCPTHYQATACLFRPIVGAAAVIQAAAYGRASDFPVLQEHEQLHQWRTQGMPCCETAPSTNTPPEDLWGCLTEKGYSIVRSDLSRGGGETTVALAEHSRTKTRVVVKVIQCSTVVGRKRTLAELSALHLVSFPRQSPYIVPLIESIGDDRRLALVMPYMPGGSLHDAINHSGSLGEEDGRRYFAHLVRGLLHMKMYGLAHGNVALDNVVLSGEGPNGEPQRALWVDLGSCCMVERDGKCAAGSYQYGGGKGYVSPEVMEGAASAASVVDPFAVDVWGLASCLYSLLTGRPLYGDPANTAFSNWLVKGKADQLLSHHESSYGLRIGKEAHDLLCAMLRPDPAARPMLEQILRHQWLAKPLPAHAAATSAAAGVTPSRPRCG